MDAGDSQRYYASLGLHESTTQTADSGPDQIAHQI